MTCALSFLLPNGFIFTRIYDSGNEESLGVIQQNYNELPQDKYLDRKWGSRFRQFGIAQISEGRLSWNDGPQFVQSELVNPMFGNVKRQFAPIGSNFRDNGWLNSLLHMCWHCVHEADSSVEPVLGVHLIRTTATSGFAAYPTPEGIHRDGFRFISIHLINRVNLDQEDPIGTVYNEDGSIVTKMRLVCPGDSIFLDDRKFKHFVPAYFPYNPMKPAHRDIVVITYGNSVS